MTNRHVRRQLQSRAIMTRHEVQHVYSIWSLPNHERWRLYRYWAQQLIGDLRMQRTAKEQQYETLSRRLQEVVQQEDKDILQQATVIGMTTTGAAKYQNVLQQIRPPVIVVEEAAEVLEAHIITALTPGCKHLILIGDHKQLRPNPTVYKLARDFNLEISLFERMVKNQMPYECLEQQHRMRPEISVLMKHIYNGLKDHESVKNMDDIKGVCRNIFLIDHQQPETHNEEIMSHANEHEAKYILRLCQYLMKQGYSASQISMLTTYKGQLFKMKALMKKNSKQFTGVRTTVVDNFQGEENDIILLSLVRSNDENRIGFLSIENRVCVALSRARKGFFVIGNFKQLAEQSPLWQKIVTDMQKQKCIGKALLLACQNHPDSVINAITAEDFNKAPEGGCMLPCDARMPCGHKCVLPCHPYDADHKEIKCRKRCEKLLCSHDHQCPKKCWENCGPCVVLVDKVIPQCGHQQKVPCHISAEKFSCREICRKRLECGHRCQRKCGQKCLTERECTHEVTKELKCGHKQTMMCHLDIDTVKCTTPCTSTLKCEHQCKGTCGECHRGRLHAPCTSKCGRTLVCGHPCYFPCTNVCPPCAQQCQNYCSHSRCQKRCGEDCAPCLEPCLWNCPHFKCKQKCGDPCDRPPCNIPCEKTLKCGHQCIGLCGEPCPMKCRVCHRAEVTELLFGSEDEPTARFVQLDCGHVIEVDAMDKWMNLTAESESSDDETNTEAQSIQFKCCPKCKTPVMHTPRYGNAIKSLLKDIEKVKALVRGSDNTRKVTSLKAEFTQMKRLFLVSLGENKRETDDIKRNLRINRIRTLLREEDEKDHRDPLLHDVCHMILQFLREKLQDEFLAVEKLSTRELALLETRMNVTREVIKLLKKLRKTNNDVIVQRPNKHLMVAMVSFVEWLFDLKDGISDQQADDMSLELERLILFTDCVTLRVEMKASTIQFKEEDVSRPENIYQKLFKSGVCLSKQQLSTVRSYFEDMRKKYPLSGISTEEKAEIVKAIGLPTGHWFKCPKGHIYAIGDCGGANQESTCPECGAAIGGLNHRLAAGNVVATEMDGARHGAFSDEANIALGAQMLYED